MLSSERYTIHTPISCIEVPIQIDIDALTKDYTNTPNVWSNTHPTQQQSLHFDPENLDENPLLGSSGALSTSPENERRFSKIVAHLKGTETANVLSQLPLSVFRGRYMKLEAKSCYSIHTDYFWRVHIPLVSNPNCRLIFFDTPEIYYLEVGKVYLVNTLRPHSYINGGTDNRVHIVASIDSQNPNSSPLNR